MPKTKNPEITLVEFVAPAKGYEEEMDSAFTEEAPRGKFSKVVLNELVSALRDAQSLMGFAEGDLYPMFESDQKVFPPEFVRALAMLAKAAEDYGQPDLIVLGGLKDDAGVANLAAKIQSLVADEDFAAWLAEPISEEEDMGDSEDPMEAMFTSRVR